MISNKLDIEDENDKYWKEPQNHALVKECHNGIIYYFIYTTYPRFMILLCDDLDDASKLANKMIDNGVKIYDNFLDLYELYKTK